MLDDSAEVPRAGLHPKGQVPAGGARGAGQSQPQQASHLPEDQEAVLLPQAHGHGPGVHREVAELLRAGPCDGKRGDTWACLQQDDHAPLQQLRPDVLWAGLQHTPVLASVAVQL